MLDLRNLNIKSLAILLVVILGICLSIYFIFHSAKPVSEPLSPTQGKQHIEKVQVLFVHLLRNPSGYDIIARIENPNELWGVPRLEYTFRLLNSEGKTIVEKEGISFIAPQEEKYLIELGLYTLDNASKAELKLRDRGWKKFEEYQKPEFSIVNKHYHKINGVNKIWGILRNDSPYGFVRVGINVVVFNEKQNIIGASHTFVGNILSRKERYFEVRLMKKISNISQIEVEPEVNAMEPANYMKDYGEPSGYEERETRK